MENDSYTSRAKRLLTKYGVEPKKQLGQNFIVEPTICPKIADAVGGGSVLEIGPGAGALTCELASRAQKLVAVELDGRMLPLLGELLADFDNVSVVQGDAMKLDFRALFDEHFPEGGVTVAGNLPYYITTPLIMRFIELRLPIKAIVVMVQKEAAQRLCAQEGSRECGAVTLAVRYACEPRILFDVSRGCFYPQPSVTSSVIRLDMRSELAVRPRDERRMFSTIKAAFAQRRKTAVNAISNSLGLEKSCVIQAFQRAGIDENARAETLTLAQYAALSDAMFV